ncbi:hypothetical protein NSU_0814 [Novosphingobium pentaromativorans US6-1]|uniref:Uncharacterized protein n=1 Tax=Novosphingobium pentaromativorans US6-1 TaxID=1088721 RepID=G6E8Z3_9SPHN|nr:hypothetical protein NSU_0814 [Novosphingobium pentaromativorans US6-1]
MPFQGHCACSGGLNQQFDNPRSARGRPAVTLPVAVRRAAPPA